MTSRKPSDPAIAGRPFRRVLVANRGEIAVRILRGCRQAGLSTAAVYSAADRGSPHVRLADRAVEIGPAPARESYLRGERVLDAARRLEADAIHPGYGFLAESAAFAAAVEDAGLVWIGPPPEAIRAMGEKTAARRAMEAAGVVVVPGSTEVLADVPAAIAAAGRTGYPVLLKAAAGGGGTGMRVVRSERELEAAFQAATREAAGAFGDPALYLEKVIDEARHVEIQIVADTRGGTIHLGERECSLQRRHQKVLEEAPAPGLPPSIRARMGEVAIRAARAVGYVGAGTIEFLLAPDGTFHFLEMNTRIQVEHPVTEMVTGLDLVALQLSAAAGEPLPVGQEDVELAGHAVECRIAAEDPAAGFLPSTGTVTRYREPGGPGVRFDSGIAAGVTVGPHYDSLLAKLVVHGRTRNEALARARAALDETEIGGLTTNLSFQRALLDDPPVAAGRVHTRTLEARAGEILERMTGRRRSDEPLAAALAAWRADSDRAAALAPPEPGRGDRSGWREAGRWVWYR
ncbi:MAG TPA: acetyl-CoA carboxylase biotin carboxylase subunit [Gemmatimonadota bacterium]|nr:acetyl-CoA carboxylase biotin carboxylase subunit [Gemmatimonadota bacterium]